MMEEMKKMSEEFRARKRMGEMVSNDQFAKLKEALATINRPPKDGAQMRQMIGALTMKQEWIHIYFFNLHINKVLGKIDTQEKRHGFLCLT